jgi:hypothetical protein
VASLDPAAGQVVIRLVYDGPPRSGKTTSLRSLAGSFALRLITPEEAGGRTLLFDWMDYVGGRFEGYDIRCQIISVPGQAAVRLALDRVRVMLREKRFATGPVRIDSAGALLRDLLAAEEEAGVLPGSAGDVAAQALREAVALEDGGPPPSPSPSPSPSPLSPAMSLPAYQAPAPPHDAVPGGLIWPPVDGRSIVHEAVSAGPVISRRPDGGWTSPEGGRWLLLTYGEAVYDDLERGRGDLLAWASIHARHLEALSPKRALVLAETGHGTWRLWQVLHRERSLADLLAESLREGLAEEVANRLTAASRLLLRAAGTFPAGVAATLRSVGLSARQPVLVAPMPAGLAKAKPALVDLHALLRRELAGFLPGVAVGPAFDLSRTLLRLGQFSDRGQLSESLVKLLAEALIRHL